MRKYLLISIILVISTANSVLATPRGYDCFLTRSNILICETDTGNRTKTKLTDKEVVQYKKISAKMLTLLEKDLAISRRSVKLKNIKNEFLSSLILLQADKKINEFKGIYDTYSQLKIDELELKIKILDTKIAEYGIESAEYILAAKELQGKRDSLQR